MILYFNYLGMLSFFIFFEDKFLPVSDVCSNLAFPPLIVTDTTRQ